MKIVHTADWHIGKSIKGRHRGGEYREILDELKEFLLKESVEILLVAGDIFDSSTPSAEAEDIVYNFFHDISLSGIYTVVIAGNHDSGLRFEAISNLMALAKVTMRGFANETDRAKILLPCKDGSKAQIVLLPFLPERTYIRAEALVQEETNTHKIYSQEIGELLQRLCRDFRPDTVNIVVAHLLMHGSRPGGGERRLYLGDNYAVYPEAIPSNIDYMAIGHIHLQQKIEAPSPIYYPGSILQLDFGESNTEKGFLFLDAKPGQKAVPEFIPFRYGKKLKEIKGTLEEITKLSESDPGLKDAYLKITVKADASSLGVSHQVKKIFPDAVDIRKEYESSPSSTITQKTHWLPELYRQYYQKQYPGEIPQNIMAEFQSIYARCSEEKKNG
ncbi:MAG: exonuclease SbcCD subunit D [Candidatus Brocadiae bacterium]|nr:exonuclease SbcCD subunit D [Candidatus Brocadiia bacterium]